MLLVVFGLVGELAKCGLGSGAVDLLCRVLRRRAEGHVLGEAVPVAVGGDGAGVPAPCRCLAGVTRWLTEGPRPGLRGVARGVEYRVCAGLDQLSPLIEGCRMSRVIGPSAEGMSPAMSRGVLRVRPEPAGRAVARATR